MALSEGVRRELAEIEDGIRDTLWEHRRSVFMVKDWGADANGPERYDTTTVVMGARWYYRYLAGIAERLAEIREA